MAEVSALATNSPTASTIGAVILAWLVPGGGHFMLRRNIRGALIFVSVLVMFLLGLAMRGAFFTPQSGDTLTMIIYYGGFVAHVASGALYFVTVALGYNQPDIAGHMYDYGAKFLVGAGLLNILAIVDAYEIAMGRKS